MRRNGYAPDALIETLHTVQSAFGYLDDTELRFVAHELHIPLSKVYLHEHARDSRIRTQSLLLSHDGVGGG